MVDQYYYLLIKSCCIFAIYLFVNHGIAGSNGDVCCGPLRPHFKGQSNSVLRCVQVGNCGKTVACSKVVKIVQPTLRHIAILGQDPHKDG